MTCPELTKLSISREGFGFSQLCIETRNGACSNRLGMKEVSTGNWITEDPSDAKGSAPKVESWTKGESASNVVGQTCHKESFVERLT